MTWATETKKSLTPREVVMVAHAHLICGIDQHQLAGMYGVNPARVAEAIAAMRETAENHMKVYRERERRKDKALSFITDKAL